MIGVGRVRLEETGALHEGERHQGVIEFDLGGLRIESDMDQLRVEETVTAHFLEELAEGYGEKAEAVKVIKTTLEQIPGPLLIPTYRVELTFDYDPDSNPWLTVTAIITALTGAGLAVKIIFGAAVAVSVTFVAIYVLIPTGRTVRRYIDEVGQWSPLVVPVVLVLGFIWLYRKV